MQSNTDVTVGTIVADRDGTSPDGVVVNYPPIPAEDWHVQGRGTLAEDNPDYPADDRATVVIFEDDLERHYPEYAGFEGIPMAQLNADDAPFYTFPESRLRPVDELEQPEISLAAIEPAPYHARNFDINENREFVESIADRGRPEPLPVVRSLEAGYQILNGHKRIWASHVAALEEIPVAVLPLDDYRAAQYWAQRHLPGYGHDEQRVALNRLRDRFSDTQVEQIAGEWLSDATADATTAACTDGGRDE